MSKLHTYHLTNQDKSENVYVHHALEITKEPLEVICKMASENFRYGVGRVPTLEELAKYLKKFAFIPVDELTYTTTLSWIPSSSPVEKTNSK